MSVPKLSVNNSAEANVQTADIEPRRVLSIQSHVVSGYVGESAYHTTKTRQTKI